MLRLFRGAFPATGFRALGFRRHILNGKVGDLEVGDFGFQLRQFFNQLVQAFLSGLVELAQALAGDFPIQEEPVRAGHLVAHLLNFQSMGLKQVIISPYVYNVLDRNAISTSR